MKSQSFYMSHNQTICSESCGKLLCVFLLITLHPFDVKANIYFTQIIKRRIFTNEVDVNSI